MRRLIGERPRLCAIWTPQHGEKEGELCFINGKCNHFISKKRDFQEESFRISRNHERTSKKLGTFWRILPSFCHPLPYRDGNPDDFFFVVDHEVCACVSDRSHTPTCIAHTMSFRFLYSPSPHNSLISCALGVKIMPREEHSRKPSPQTNCPTTFYRRRVKR